MGAGWLAFFARFDAAQYGTDGGPLHDPKVIGRRIALDLGEGRFVIVEIEAVSDPVRGMTVADWWGDLNRARNVLRLRDVDAEGFLALLTGRPARLG